MGETVEEGTHVSTSNYPPGGTWEIDNGWDVVTSDGEKIGDVDEVHPHYLVVSKGWLFPTERYVPVSTITNVEDNTVHLSVSKSEVDNQGWDTIPDIADMTSTTNSSTMDTTDTSRMTDTSQMTDTTDTSRRDTTRNTDTTRTDDLKVPVMEEELDVRKRQVERGSVRGYKDVVEETEQVSVPVREETIRVERHATTDQDATDIGEHAFQQEDIEIPLRGEEVEVDTHAVVREHVHISKDVREHDEQVSGTVRREDVVVEGEDTQDVVEGKDPIDRTNRP